MACLLYASLGLFCGPHREGENKNKFWNGWEIHFTHSISLFRTHSRQNFRIGRICLFFSHFFFFILFLLFTLSINQIFQVTKACRLLASIRLGPYHSHLGVIGFPTIIYLPQLPSSSTCAVSSIILSLKVFSFDFFFSLVVKWKDFSPVKGVLEN